MKKIICVVWATLMVVTTISPAFATSEVAQNSSLVEYTLYSTEEEVCLAHQRNVEEAIEEKEQNDVLAGKKTVETRNDISDYRTEYSESHVVEVAGKAGNQPLGGITIYQDTEDPDYNPAVPAGSIHYQTSGANSNSVSVSIPFTEKWGGTIGVSLSLGRRIKNGVSDYEVFIYPNKTYLLYVENTYNVKAFTTYKRVWVDDMVGYQWVEYTGGISKVLVHVGLEARVIG